MNRSRLKQQDAYLHSTSKDLRTPLFESRDKLDHKLQFKDKKYSEQLNRNYDSIKGQDEPKLNGSRKSSKSEKTLQSKSLDLYVTQGVDGQLTFNEKISKYFKIMIVLIIFAVIFLTFYRYDEFIQILLTLFQRVAVDPLTSFYYIWAIYFFSIIFLLPTVYLTVGVGWAYSRTYPNIISFILSRYIFRQWFTNFISKRYPNYIQYNYAIQKEGWRFVFFMQFSLIPYSLLCYLFGLTNVSLIQFAVGALGMSIPNLFWAYVGSIMQNIMEIADDESKSGEIEKLIFMSIGFLIAIYGIYKVSQRAKEHVRMQMAESDQQKVIDQQINGDNEYQVPQPSAIDTQDLKTSNAYNQF
ncbi:UNKNOWN [Stylonychia lemnae]|uniref:VTT domain-containing protein n=1 Tax=Stylonychia lemnae TaxID=5949 RepID=A0A078AV13_STYLE|nr:UNKNOWN [Stylonychia lemnae]|eukprot:CDW86044.1 UNKNOWN [Stylonychia lemnae]